MAWQTNGTPDTLTSAGDLLSISNLEAKKFNMFMDNLLPAGGVVNVKGTFNSNSNSVYATRRSDDGNTDSNVVSRTFLDLWFNSRNTDFFHIMYTLSVSGEEKLGIGFLIEQVAAGAATPPSRLEYVNKFVPSPDADITRFDLLNDNVGDYDTDTNLSALGTD